MTLYRNRVHNGADIVDSRDILKRIAELESTIDDQKEDTENYPDGPEEDLTDELKILNGVVDELDHPRDGITLIRDSYFEQYARDYAEDIGAISRHAKWPLDCIDWEQAAGQLQNDFSSLEWDGITYWYQS